MLALGNLTQNRGFQDFGGMVVILGGINDGSGTARNRLPPEPLGQNPVDASRRGRGIVRHTWQSGCDFCGFGNRRH